MALGHIYTNTKKYNTLANLIVINFYKLKGLIEGRIQKHSSSLLLLKSTKGFDSSNILEFTKEVVLDYTNYYMILKYSSSILAVARRPLAWEFCASKLDY